MPRTPAPLALSLVALFAAAAPARADEPKKSQAKENIAQVAETVQKHVGTPPAKATAPVTIEKVTKVEGITEYKLGNGLKLLLYPDQSKPTVTVNITVFVGSRHEGYGETGMAHLLEHMLFKGTPKHPDVWKLLQDHGAEFNGTTWLDRTNYYEQLPATPANLEFAIGLEADRLINSTIAAEALAKEFSVVRNEFEMGENDPGSVLQEKMFAAAYQWHNYGKSTIGSRSDIERVPVENLRAFYRRYYQPDNAMLIVAGKFDEAQALELVKKHFGGLPRPARQLPKTWTEEPVQDGERQVTLRRTGEVAVVGALYHGVAGPDPDWLATDALVDVLTNQPAGRLYKALVEKGLASQVFGFVYPTAEPGVIFVGAKVRPGGSPEKVRDVLLNLTEGLGNAKITEAEVDRWRTRSIKDFELALTDTNSIGVVLSDWAAMGDWRLFFKTRDRLKAVKAEDLTRVAKSFVKPSNRTLGMFLPTKAPDRAPLASTPDVAALMKDYQGSAEVSEGEVFAATIDNVEKRTQRATLPSGLKLALLPKKTKGGAVRVILTLHYGSEGELKGKTAVAGAVPAMLIRGSAKHSFQQIKDELDRLKAEVSFGGGGFSVSAPGSASVHVKTVRENLPAVLTLIAEVLQKPTFPKAEFEIVRKETLAGLEEQLQDPMANGFTSLIRKVFPAPKGDVRYMPSIKESIDMLKALSVAEVAKLHKTLWGAGAAQLAVVGDFDEAGIKAQVDKELGGWKAAKPFARIPHPYKDGVAEEEVINTPDKQMAFVAVGHPIELRDDEPDYPALVMVNHVLGGSASSRLLNRLRQKDGLSYGAFSGARADSEDRVGFVFAGAICAPQNADKAMAAMLEEIDKLLKDGVPANELGDAKKSYAATWDNRIADDDFVAGELVDGLYLGRSFEYWKKVNEKIQALTPADLQRVAKKYILPAKFAKVRAGDLAKKAS